MLLLSLIFSVDNFAASGSVAIFVGYAALISIDILTIATNISDLSDVSTVTSAVPVVAVSYFTYVAPLFIPLMLLLYLPPLLSFMLLLYNGMSLLLYIFIALYVIFLDSFL